MEGTSVRHIPLLCEPLHVLKGYCVQTLATESTSPPTAVSLASCPRSPTMALLVVRTPTRRRMFGIHDG